MELRLLQLITSKLSIFHNIFKNPNITQVIRFILLYNTNGAFLSQEMITR